MAEIPVLNLKREEVGRVSLPDAVYARPWRRHMVYEAVRAFRAAAHSGDHKTKNRVEVSGGGRKPWKQKGTGRSRHGSIRSPLWRKGGTIFGPVPRDYSFEPPRKVRRGALAAALSDKVRSGQFVVVESLALEQPKTRVLAGLVRDGLALPGKVLLVFDGENPSLELAARNHEDIAAVRALALHAYHVLDHETVVISRAAAEQLGEVLSR